jgi:hypothetical protein
MHQIIRSWDSLTSMPAGCRTVSFSSWTRFSPHSRNTSKTGLKASVLCADAGITPDFDPPLLERAYLGIDQPIESEEPVMEMKRVNRKKREKRHDSGVSSWTIESASTSMAASTRARGMMSSSKPITFRKIEVKTPSPSNSLLTEAVVRASMVRARELQRPCIMKVRISSFPCSFAL